jgi:hypothetical protein
MLGARATIFGNTPQVSIDEQSACRACGAPATEVTDPDHLGRSTCGCGHLRDHDHRPDRLQPLPIGATGFLPSGDWTPPDPRRVLDLIHEVGRNEGRNVGELRTTATLRSFRYVHLAHRHEASMWALFHRVVPVVAFADVNPEHELSIGQQLSDWSALPSDRVAGCGWVLLSGERSRERPKDSDLVALSTHEIAEIRRWRPSTIGEILFNHWD